VTCRDITITSLTQEATPTPKTGGTSITKKKGIAVTEVVTHVAGILKRIKALNEGDLLPEITTSELNLIGNHPRITNQLNVAALRGNQISSIQKTK